MSEDRFSKMPHPPKLSAEIREKRRDITLVEQLGGMKSEATDAELARLAEAATPGPWVEMDGKVVFADRPNRKIFPRICNDGDACDMRYIAAINPDRLKRLLAEKQALSDKYEEQITVSEGLRNALIGVQTVNDELVRLVRGINAIAERVCERESTMGADDIEDISLIFNMTSQVAADALRDNAKGAAMSAPSVDLDKIEALAKAAPKHFGPTPDTWAYIETLDPAVVLQWVAETRALRKERAWLIQAFENTRSCSCLNDIEKAYKE